MSTIDIIFTSACCLFLISYFVFRKWFKNHFGLTSLLFIIFICYLGFKVIPAFGLLLAILIFMSGFFGPTLSSFLYRKIKTLCSKLKKN